MTPPMTTTRKIGVAIAVLVALFVAFNLVYFMPRATKVKIIKTEVQRKEAKNAATGADRSRDQLLVYTEDFETGDTLVLRNEDNAWYLKFDSSDVAAKASKLAKDDDGQPVLVKYYGLRIPILSQYPNVLSLDKVDADYVYVPWFQMIVLVVLLFGFIWGGVKLRKAFRAAKERITNRPAAS